MTAETIIEAGKVVSAILCMIGIPIGIFKFLKGWNKKLFEKIENLERSVRDIKNEIHNMKEDNKKRFNDLSDEIKDMRGTSRTFYSVLNIIIEIMYKNHPDKELADAKKTINDELIDKATHQGGGNHG